MKKLPVLAAGAAGYVLGARAGRQRYEQIASGARSVMGNPKVQAASSTPRTPWSSRQRTSARRPRRPLPAGLDRADKVRGNGGAHTAPDEWPPRPAARFLTAYA